MEYIGIVEWTSKDKNENNIAGVTPLYKISNSSWEGVNKEASNEEVFWFDSKSEKNELIYFTVKENYNDAYSKPIVNEYDPVTEILDFRSLGSTEDVRKAFTSGLSFSDPIPYKAFLWCQGGTIIGPLKIVKLENEKIMFDASQVHKIPCYSTDDTKIQELDINTSKRYVCQNQRLLNTVSYVDWDNDRNIIKRSLEFAINKSDEIEFDSAKIKKIITDLYYLLKDGSDSAELKLEVYRLKRSVNLINSVDISNEWADELVKDISSLSIIQEKLKLARQRAEKETRETINGKLNIEIERIEALRIEKEKLDIEVVSKKAELEEVKNKIEFQTVEVEQEIEKRLESIINKPAKIIADSALMKATLPYLNLGNKKLSSNDSKSPSNIKWLTSENKVLDFNELKKQIFKGFSSIGLKKESGVLLHAALSAKVLPILTGFNATTILEIYSKVVCAGRMFCINVSPTTIDVNDLFGTFDRNKDIFIEQENSLIEINEIASQKNEPALVVFEGINRAPTESYFLPILQSVFFGKELSIPNHRNFKWSKNLYPIATVVDGATTLPLSNDIWNRSILIEADEDYFEGLGSIITEGDVDNKLFNISQTTELDLDYLFEEFEDFKKHKRLLTQFLKGLENFYDLASDGTQILIETNIINCLILPLIARMNIQQEIDKEISSLLGLNNPNYKDSQAVNKNINEIRRKIT